MQLSMKRLKKTAKRDPIENIKKKRKILSQKGRKQTTL